MRAVRRADFIEAPGGASGDDALHSLQGRPGAHREGVRIAAPVAARVFFLLSLAPLVGCVGVFAEDGSSVSVGTHARGALIRGVALPTEGAGYRVPEPWVRRGRQYGTEEV